MRQRIRTFIIGAWLLVGAVVACGQDLDQIRRNLASGNVELERSALFAVKALHSSEASRLALASLSDNNELVRATAVSAVIYLPEEEVVRALVPLLSDKSEFVRQETAYALGEARSGRAAPALISLLKTGTDPVMNASAVALGKIGDPSAIEPLLAILRKKATEDNEFTRRSAARSIGQIAQFQRTGTRDDVIPHDYLPARFKPVAGVAPNAPVFSRAATVLSSVLRSKKEADDTRRQAAYALGALGDPAAIPLLNGCSGDADIHLAEICKEGLLRLGGK